MSMSPADSAKALGLGSKITFSVSPCQEFMRTTDQCFDLIFLDGAHGAWNVYQELDTALRLLNKDGVILLHDYYPEGRPLFPNGKVLAGPFRAMARVRKENSAIEVLPLGVLP